MLAIFEKKVFLDNVIIARQEVYVFLLLFNLISSLQKAIFYLNFLLEVYGSNFY